MYTNGMEIGALLLGLFGIVLALAGVLLTVAGIVLSIVFRWGIRGGKR
jgi:hypothetical protein